MRYFVVSDIHGHYDELLEALKESNFDENNKDHQLIVAGDMFDRGSKNLEVYQYLFRLNKENKAIIIKGNHELFFYDIFNQDTYRFNWNCRYNGFDKTMESFLPGYKKKRISEIKDLIEENYPNLKQWLDDLPYFYETEQYVITHAGLDFKNGDFREGNLEEAVWIQTEHFFEEDLVNEYNFHKTVVVGHRFTTYLRRFLESDLTEDDYSIYYSDDGQKIGIDSGVYYSKKINVLTFEE